MKFATLVYSISALIFSFSCLNLKKLNAEEKALPEEMNAIIQMPKYAHSIWGMHVKDLQTGKILFDLNSEKLFSPASTTKLFTVTALLSILGDDFRFKTPVFASGKIENGKLKGNLILVAQGDLTMGGRQTSDGKIAFTKLDHGNANAVPGAVLTEQNPLHGINELAKQVYESGIKEIDGNIFIDDSLFETTEKRGLILSPIMINENLIDLVINPAAEIDQKASILWRPQIKSYEIDNQLKTVEKESESSIEITSDESGKRILVKGTVPIGQKNIVRTFPIKDPKSFARDAFLQALQEQGVTINPNHDNNSFAIPLVSYDDLQQVALWSSPPLTEYAKLILKVSHNLGADLVPLLLASKEGKKTFDEGMRILGDFLVQRIKLSPDSFVFVDAAGGNDNRLTPQAETQLLEFIYKWPASKFQHFFDALPILGVDGSLEEFGKGLPAAGKIHAKTGTGVSFNLATGTYFLTTQALAGYIKGKNGHLLAYMLVVNNARMPSIQDVFAIFEEEARLSGLIYDHSQ